MGLTRARYELIKLLCDPNTLHLGIIWTIDEPYIKSTYHNNVARWSPHSTAIYQTLTPHVPKYESHRGPTVASHKFQMDPTRDPDGPEWLLFSSIGLIGFGWNKTNFCRIKFFF